MQQSHHQLSPSNNDNNKQEGDFSSHATTSITTSINHSQTSPTNQHDEIKASDNRLDPPSQTSPPTTTTTTFNNDTLESSFSHDQQFDSPTTHSSTLKTSNKAKRLSRMFRAPPALQIPLHHSNNDVSTNRKQVVNNFDYDSPTLLVHSLLNNSMMNGETECKSNIQLHQSHHLQDNSASSSTQTPSFSNHVFHLNLQKLTHSVNNSNPPSMYHQQSMESSSHISSSSFTPRGRSVSALPSAHGSLSARPYTVTPQTTTLNSAVTVKTPRSAHNIENNTSSFGVANTFGGNENVVVGRDNIVRGRSTTNVTTNMMIPRSATTPRQVTFAEFNSSYEPENSSVVPSNPSPISANAILNYSKDETESPRAFPTPIRTNLNSHAFHVYSLPSPSRVLAVRHTNDLESRVEALEKQTTKSPGGLTPRKLVQVAATIKSKLSPRGNMLNISNTTDEFTGLVDEEEEATDLSNQEMEDTNLKGHHVYVDSGDLKNNHFQQLDSSLTTSNSIVGVSVDSNDQQYQPLNIVKSSSDGESILNVSNISDINIEEIASMINKSHQLQTSEDSNNRYDNTAISLSPSYLAPFKNDDMGNSDDSNNLSSCCQSPPTGMELLSSMTKHNNLETTPTHIYSTSDLSTIVPGMKIFSTRVSAGNDMEGKSVTSTHKKKRQVQLHTCCGTIEFSCFRLIALISLIVNIAAFIWLAVLLSMIYINERQEMSGSLLSNTAQNLDLHRERMEHYAKLTALSASCSPFMTQHVNFTLQNQTKNYLEKFESHYEILTKRMDLLLPSLPDYLVKTYNQSMFLQSEQQAMEMVKQGTPLNALQFLESTNYTKNIQDLTMTLIKPMIGYFYQIDQHETSQMLLLSLMGLVVVLAVSAFLVPLIIAIIVCAVNRDSLYLNRLNKANAVMLLDTMQNETLRELFRKHCEQEYASENFTILEKISEYKKLCEKSLEIQLQIYDPDNNNNNEGETSSTTKRKTITAAHTFAFDDSPSPSFRGRRNGGNAGDRDSKRLRNFMFKRQYNEKDMDKVESEKYEVAFEIYTEYLDVHGDKSVNINKKISEQVKEQMDSYAKGTIDVLPDYLFDTVEQEICIVLLDTHHRFKESLAFQRSMKIDKLNRAKLQRKQQARANNGNRLILAKNLSSNPLQN
ncbi:hypothetical protein C9374_003832 [Naegleria lovaniensis]|uniref:RGS domain-containing protein n=1 Tax=Naegleria lovaniensis TaxID=51637 RepID=A0AA88GZU8_NAELO|nr:uncharacterized protein C9374_003832 [Naegleria lovaniensis]KAG2394068.1 hypothetical protein C9374_003832 [Naegleria lovaniensis]